MTQVHVYAAAGFEEVELVTTVDILRRAEIETLLVSLNEDLAVTGSHQMTLQVDLTFAEAAVETPTLIVLPGGPGANVMLQHAPLQQRLREQIAASRPVAAICAAPKVLAKAGLLQGKKATCFPGFESLLAEAGAIVSPYNVVSDGLITTSRGAGTAALFALELVRLLGKDNAAHQVGRAMLYL
ncbi:DJ-1 family glyoxalase III [Amantichitinum ursilacus]|uniref:Chaperone protein YajL n=1 Tax=Amantichitinum ursilacus TaxID=857265 RepID=A0A0N1JT21_9NEIS|nr:DJ-1 family glyoxalase III [Amantichitinum ursilacus]KPC53828.1 Chaperone protein YajL [Amantichitinum ursilacus]